ncbi:unnamed protein product [Rotaria sordida]|uniref:Uncharacterized protein n=1 Tax=Rotaria sordida TaxID=392033 RepID=A0A814IUW0_9BILA|nr:unnamed protein product [Rotaria sordida]CAF3541419.1 unnamed protein product [Rotaria sordida]
MLIHNRSLCSRVFVFDISTSKIHFDKTFDNVDDDLNEDNDLSNIIDYCIGNSTNSINNADDAKLLCNIESMNRLLSNFHVNLNHGDHYPMTYLGHDIIMDNYNMVDILVKYDCDLYESYLN